MDDAKKSAVKDVFLRPFGLIFMSASLVLNSGAAGAIESASSFMPGSSSLYLSQETKLLDMSLPSYGSISNPTAGENSIDFVNVEKKDNTAGAPAGARKKSREQKNVEPRKRSQSEEIDLKANFKKRPVFSGKDEVSIEEKRQEKEKKKNEVKATKKEKQAVVISEEKEDDGLSLNDVTVVDMNMPSYGDSTTKKSKGVFAL